MSSDGGIPQKAYDSRTTVPYSDNSWMNRLNNALIPILTPENIDAFRESCPVQVAVHGVMGFGFGGIFGLFISGMGPTSYELANPTTTTSLTKESIKSIFKDMGTRVLSNAKTFGKIGAIYSAFECTVESYRGRHDLYNVGAAGSLTGAALAIKSGPKAMLFGSAGFAAFSVLIESIMNR